MSDDDRTSSTYADITVNDRNRIKRRLQRRRLDDAIEIASATLRSEPVAILDFGGGDGQLAARVKSRWPGSLVVCFEPTPELRRQGEVALAGTGVVVSQAVPTGARYGLVFCLEVLEHLPPDPLKQALDALRLSMEPDGLAVLGVPNETGPVALGKGIFRMMRRYGAYDARPGNVLRATLGRTFTDRPILDIANDLAYIYPHTGFDYRALLRMITRASLRLERVVGSPFPRLPRWMNPEIYMVIRSETDARASAQTEG